MWQPGVDVDLSRWYGCCTLPKQLWQLNHHVSQRTLLLTTTCQLLVRASRGLDYGDMLCIPISTRHRPVRLHDVWAMSISSHLCDLAQHATD